MLTFFITLFVALIILAVTTIFTTTKEETLPQEWSFGPISKEDAIEMVSALDQMLKKLNQCIEDVSKMTEFGSLTREIQIMCINRSILTVKVLRELAVRGLGYRLPHASHIWGVFNISWDLVIDSMKKGDSYSNTWRANAFKNAIDMNTELELVIARADCLAEAIRNEDIVIESNWNVLSNFNGKKTLEKLNQ